MQDEKCEKIRQLLLSVKTKERKHEASLQLSALLAEDDGIIHLLNSVFDFDESSQKTSTHLQRLLAVATIVAKMPKLVTSEEIYFERLSHQLFRLLVINENNKPQVANKLWKAASHIAVALNERNAELSERYILGPLLKSLESEEYSIYPYSINDIITAIWRLITCKFPLKQLYVAFPKLFYARVKVQKTQLPLKCTLNNILMELISSDVRTVHLLENTLFCKNHLYNSYTLTDCDVLVVSSNTSEHCGAQCNLEKVDDITQTCVTMLEKSSDDFKIDFFNSLVDRLSLSSPSDSQLIVCTLIDALQLEMSTLLLKSVSKAVHFIVANLDRVVNRLNEEQFDFGKVEFDKFGENTNEMRFTSLNMSLMIINQLLQCNDSEITEEDKSLLNHCSVVIDKIVNHCGLDSEFVTLAKSLRQKIIALSKNATTKRFADGGFEEAFLDLNDSEVHIRTHGLITIRRLILRKNEEALKQKHNLLIAIQALLCDEESYVYLAAIKTLAALALCSADDVLPVLFDAYRDKHRSLQERVNVGEVLINLIKDFGEMIHRYSKTFMNEFLRSLKDEEATLRISSLSNLGQLCSLLRFAISAYIIEIVNAVKCILDTDPILEVKRASIMFIHVMLNGIDRASIQAIESEVPSLYRLVKQVYNRSLDDVLQFHCQLAFDQFDRLAKELLTMRDDK